MIAKRLYATKKGQSRGLNFYIHLQDRSLSAVKSMQWTSTRQAYYLLAIERRNAFFQKMRHTLPEIVTV